MADSKLQFMATAVFLLDGVPHHIQGGWWQSKKQAQRDTADRALCFFVSVCGEQAIGNTVDARAGFVDGGLDALATSAAADDLQKAAEEGDHVKVLEIFCDGALHWKCCWEAQQGGCGQEMEGMCRATVEISCLGVPHTFAGRQCSSKAAAMQDAAKRVLWYMNCPGYESAFEVVSEQTKTLAQNIPPPVKGCWSLKQEDMVCCASPSAKSTCSDMDSNPDLGTPFASPCQQQPGQAELDRKMTVMHLQNRLQKLFAKQLTSGKSVWHWHYERSSADSTFQASVEIPVLGQSFTGGWAATHQAAQMEACNELSAFLDKTART